MRLTLRSNLIRKPGIAVYDLVSFDIAVSSQMERALSRSNMEFNTFSIFATVLQNTRANQIKLLEIKCRCSNHSAQSSARSARISLEQKRFRPYAFNLELPMSYQHKLMVIIVALVSVRLLVLFFVTLLTMKCLKIRLLRNR